MPFREVSLMDKEREFVEFARRARGRTFGSFCWRFEISLRPDTSCSSAIGNGGRIRSASCASASLRRGLRFKS